MTRLYYFSLLKNLATNWGNAQWFLQKVEDACKGNYYDPQQITCSQNLQLVDLVR